MKAAVVCLGAKSSLWTIEEMKKLFDQVDMVKISQVEVFFGTRGLELMYNGEEFPEYDCAYVKGSFRYANVARAVTSILTKRGTFLPIRASAFTTGHDKLLTHVKLQEAGVPMPTTYLAATTDAAKELLKNVNYPIVMKFPQGTHGKGVMFADSYSSASSVLDALTALRQPVIIQEFIDTNGEDIRAIVVGDKVVASMKRKAVQGDKRANIHAGGSAESCNLDAHTRKIAVDAAHAVGLGIGAVDIVESPRGPLVIEVNVSPGLQGITKATGINVAAKIAKYLYDETKTVKDSSKEEKADNVLKEAGIPKAGQEIVTNLDFRAHRILLPEVITNITKFNDKDEFVMKAEKGELVIRKFK
ncbi:RimK family alpha-L-glutamate ligase [Candidatus Woesearchaeota archaeon]|nr:RimK family alpha-L-glutamate ligase [Candidatus Woesearchaeota archaeon]MBW3021736.1 RimK family alpha-L-glutamate ligase [Candidatus Woesearchaeota archaeon]